MGDSCRPDGFFHDMVNARKSLHFPFVCDTLNNPDWSNEVSRGRTQRQKPYQLSRNLAIMGLFAVIAALAIYNAVVWKDSLAILIVFIVQLLTQYTRYLKLSRKRYGKVSERPDGKEQKRQQKRLEIQEKVSRGLTWLAAIAVILLLFRFTMVKLDDLLPSRGPDVNDIIENAIFWTSWVVTGIAIIFHVVKGGNEWSDCIDNMRFGDA